MHKLLAGLPGAAAAQSSSCGDPTALAERQLLASERPEQAVVDRSAAQAALAKIASLRRDLDAGKSLPASYEAAAEFGALAHHAKNPMLAELFRRAAMDPLARSHLFAAASPNGWAAGLSAAAKSYVLTIAADLCGLDEANTAWLEKQIDTRGWLKSSIYGLKASNAACLIAQHADLNKPFQKKALALMEPLLATRDVAPQDYALLFDRVAVSEGRPHTPPPSIRRAHRRGWNRWRPIGRCSRTFAQGPRLRGTDPEASSCEGVVRPIFAP